MKTIDVQYIANTLGLAYATVRDKKVKQPGFPKPCYNGKQKKWLLRDFEKWLEDNTKYAA